MTDNIPEPATQSNSEPAEGQDVVGERIEAAEGQDAQPRRVRFNEDPVSEVRIIGDHNVAISNNIPEPAKKTLAGATMNSSQCRTRESSVDAIALYCHEQFIHYSTLPKLKVLNRMDKTLIHYWAANMQDETIPSWKGQVKEDLEEFTWTDKMQRNLPDTWQNHPAYSVWSDIAAWASQNMQHEIVPKLVLLKGIFQEQEKRGVDIQFHEHLDDISQKLSKMSRKMEKRL
ncbi:hypothetical protein ACHAQJ_006172 [Trichoderma viride]